MTQGRVFTLADVVIRMAGLTITGATEIEYKTNTASENVYGNGRDPIGYSIGRNAYEGSITLLQNELAALLAVARSQRKALPQLVFDVVVSYQGDTLADLETDTLVGCSITEIPKGLSGDDPYMESQLPLRISKIIYNTVA